MAREAAQRLGIWLNENQIRLGGGGSSLSNDQKCSSLKGRQSLKLPMFASNQGGGVVRRGDPRLAKKNCLVTDGYMAILGCFCPFLTNFTRQPLSTGLPEKASNQMRGVQGCLVP